MRNLQSFIQMFVDEHMKGHSRSTRRIYGRILLDFDLFQRNWNSAKEDWQHFQQEELILAWLRHQGRLVNKENLGYRLRLLGDFLEYLKGRHLIARNAVGELYRRCPLKGWRGLAEAAKDPNPAAAFERLHPRDRFNGPWGEPMSAFIVFKRRLGARYEFEERTLADLDRYLAEAGLAAGDGIPCVLVDQWLLSRAGNNEHTVRTKRRVAERFFEYARSLDLIRENPVGTSKSVPRCTLRPYIFSKEQIQEILRRTRSLPDIPFFPHRGETYEMVFATLYSLGLRISELCRIRPSDIDFDEGLLVIRPSKFYKSRLVALGPKYLEKLKYFMEIRGGLSQVNGEEAPLFQSYQGKPMLRHSIGRVFRNLAKEIGLKPEAGQRGPSLHSFRHSFAVHRLLRWYREGENVEAKLPLLTAFLGHVDIASTQVYLDMIPQLLEQVHLRFESCCSNQLSSTRRDQS